MAAASTQSQPTSPFHTPPSSLPHTTYGDHPALVRLREREGAGPGVLERNASTSSSRSTTTTSSTTSSLVAVPIRPPPKETSTATTGAEQKGERAASAAGAYAGYGYGQTNRGSGGSGGSGQGWTGQGYAAEPEGMDGTTSGYYTPQPEAFYGGRGFQRNGPRSGSTASSISAATGYGVPPSLSLPGRSRAGSRANGVGVEQLGGSPISAQRPIPPALSLPAIVTVSADTPRSSSVPVHARDASLSPTTPKASRFAESDDGAGEEGRLRPGSSGGPGTSPSSSLRMRHRQTPIAASPTDRDKARTMSIGAGSSQAERDASRERERRQSMASAKSAASSSGAQRVRETTADYVFGEELGRGSYSTVVQAVRSTSSPNASTTSPTSPRQRAPRQYAIKIINQAHLIQERKTKYAMIERDALVRLNAPRATATAGGGGGGGGKGHRRATSSSGPSGANAGTGGGGGGPRPNRSTTSLSGMSSGTATAYPSAYSYGRRDSTAQGGDRVSVFSDSSSSTATVAPGYPALGTSVPLSSPALSLTTVGSGTMFFTGSGSSSAAAAAAGRRPSRSADPPESVPERSDEGHEEESIALDSPMVEVAMGRSRPPSPVKEDPKREEAEAEAEDQKQTKDRTPQGKHSARIGESPSAEISPQEDHGKRRATRTSNEQDERPNSSASAPAPASGTRSRRASKAPSEKSTTSRRGKSVSHPGIIRLYSTFNDATSLYFVLELAGKGELLTYLRKYGSFDIESARYYAALVLDTVEFMHERGVIHRDLKPENILLDEDMRVKVTDFGSAKLLNKEGKDPKDEDGSQDKKRSFVGSADFVSPEVLRNEPAVAASDVWAFGCIVYQLIVGKPPFRGATDYLTFQKILKNEMEFPEGFDEDAKAMIEIILNLDSAARPNPSDLKVHPFFSSIDWPTLWHSPAPTITTGLSKPVATLATVDPTSDMWAVFEDEVSDGGFDLDDEDIGAKADNAMLQPTVSDHPRQKSHRLSPQYDARAAAQAVWSVDSPDAAPPPDPFDAQAGEGQGGRENDLQPPKPSFFDSPSSTPRKNRGLSRGSVRSSSSSSGNRMALTGLLETMGIIQPTNGGSGRTSRTSMKSDLAEARSAMMSPVPASLGAGAAAGARVASPRTPLDPRETRADLSRWNQLLLANESIVFTSPISIKTSTSSLHIPSFLSPNSAKRRQLILTDFPRIFTVKEESPSTAIQNATTLSGASQMSLSVKNECVFVVRGSAGSMGASGGDGAGQGAGGNATGSGGANRVIDVSEKGQKGFIVQTPSQTFSYMADTTELRSEWLAALRSVSS